MTSAIATPVCSTTTPGPDFTTIRPRQQATRASGDYTAVGTSLQMVGETQAAARRHAQVTSTDCVLFVQRSSPP